MADSSEQDTSQDAGSLEAAAPAKQKSSPQDWPILKKIFHTVIPCFIAFEITFSTSVMTPATLSIMARFSVSRVEATLVLTLYTLGIAFGPLFIAPLSEVFGRRWLYVGTLSFFLAFSGGAAAAQTFAALLACRFLAGFLGSAGIAIGAGTISDIWQLGKESGTAGLFFILGPFLGPTLGPLAGAYILDDHDGDWRWPLYLIVLIGAPVWVASLFMSETSAAWRSRHANPGTEKKRKKTSFTAREFVRRAILRPSRMLFLDPITSSLTVYSAYAYAMVFAYFASSSYVLPLYYGFNARQVGLSFLSIVIGYLLATALFAFFDKTIYARAAREAGAGHAAPEHRLYSGMVGSVFLPASLFWYAWEAHPDGNWAKLVASGIPFGLGAFSLFLSTITYLVEIYRAEAAASALAANGTLRYTLGAVFPLFTAQMYQNLGVHWAGSTFAFLSLGLLPIPWLLFKYGPTLRERIALAKSPAREICAD